MTSSCMTGHDTCRAAPLFVASALPVSWHTLNKTVPWIAVAGVQIAAGVPAKGVYVAHEIGAFLQACIASAVEGTHKYELHAQRWVLACCDMSSAVQIRLTRCKFLSQLDRHHEPAAFHACALSSSLIRNLYFIFSSMQLA